MAPHQESQDPTISLPATTFSWTAQ